MKYRICIDEGFDLNHGRYIRRAFAEVTEVYKIESNFKTRVEKEFDNMIEKFTTGKG